MSDTAGRIPIEVIFIQAHGSHYASVVMDVRNYQVLHSSRWQVQSQSLYVQVIRGFPRVPKFGRTAVRAEITPRFGVRFF